MIIEVEKGKNYAARFYYVDCFGKRQRVYKSGFPTEDKAKLYELQEKARLEGETVAAPQMTFGQLAREWRSSKIKEGISPKTLEKYDRYLGKHILVYFDTLPIKKVDDRKCQALIDKNLSSPCNCVEIRKVLNCIFNYARKKRWVKDNPMEFVDLPQYKPKKPPAYDFDDARTLLEKMRSENSKLYTPVLCACLFAATREEVCGLYETDITKNKNGTFRLSLDKALITVKGETYIKEQKTENRRRSFNFSLEVYNELHYFKRRNNITSAFLCCNFDGSNIQPNTISSTFAMFIQEHDLKYTTFHKLRDFVANGCKRLKVDLDTAFRIMGHGSYKVTAEHYASADDVLTAEAVGLLAKELFSDASPETPINDADEKEIRVHKDFDFELLRDIGYKYNAVEGGWIANNAATIVLQDRKPTIHYERLVAQFMKSKERDHRKNIAILRKLNYLE